jgi:hypothetical protein
MLRLTTKHYRCYDKNVPILTSADATLGPFSPNDRLPQNNGTAGDYIMRCLLNEPVAGDPPLEVDAGADKVTYCWRYLDQGTSDETRRYAERYHRLKVKRIRIPELTA